MNEYISLSRRLSEVLQRDKNCTHNKDYMVRSLYFDSYDDECLYEKLSGLMFRKKYRIRIYNFDTQVAKFEIKTKHNNQIHKESAFIKRESVDQIIRGNYSELIKYNDITLNKIFTRFLLKGYKPKVIVDYNREAYTFPFFNLRITFDKKITSNTNNYEIFSSKLHMLPIVFENKILLEVKYIDILPNYIRDILQLRSFERLSFSKYVLSRRYSKIDQWEDS